MADNIIYGVDITKEVTPLMVRDAIIECFTLAHGSEVGKIAGGNTPEDTDPKVKREAIELIVVKAFQASDGDFENPTKESIMSAVQYLKKFSENFRSPEVIEKHVGEIMILVDKLK